MASLKWIFFLLFIVNVASQETRLDERQALEDDVIVKYPSDYCATIKDYEEFDFVVVGSGPSGSAVARRLAEIPENQVLLLEAGGDPPTKTDIPSSWTKGDPELSWNIQSTRDQLSCLGNIGETCKFVPGKVLGGSSVVNGMTALRGNPQDFEDWKILGNPGWGYYDVLPYFKKLENFMALPISNHSELKCGKNGRVEDSPTVSSRYHATGGPLDISSFKLDPRTEPLRKALFEAFKANGILRNFDINGKTQIGATSAPGMVNSLGYRHSIAKAYLLNIPNNLKICKHALVHKLNINTSKTPKEVTSVKFVYAPSKSKEKTLHVKANKEYIISGGVYNTPGILERSGIGLPNILRAAGVTPIHTLNVGENFQEQYANSGSLFELNYGTSSGFNPLSIDITSFTALVNLTDFRNKVPDVQYGFFRYDPGSGLARGYKPEIKSQLDAVAAKRELLTFGSIVLRQSKFGSVHITQSSNPLLSPKIISNQLSRKKDVELTVKATRLARKIMEDKALKAFQPKPYILNKCKGFPKNSEKEIMCGARTLTAVLYHHSGTCSMGPSNDSKAVVDHQLKVRGIANLRVVDLSVGPLVPRGNTELPAVMVGEKGADLIKQTWGQLEK